MIELTGEEIAATLILERQTDPRLCLVVEGEEECALIDVHLNFKAAKTQFTRSKTAALVAAEILRNMGIDWAICVVDADFDRILEKASDWPANVLATRRYDLLVDAALDHPHNLRGVAVSHSQPGALMAFEEHTGISLQEWIQVITTPVGIVRHAVVRGEYSLSARNWNFSGSASILDLDESIAAAASQAALRSRMQADSEQVELMIRQNLADSDIDPLDVICGHDVLGALSELIGARLGGSCGKRHVAASLRLAISCAEFLSLEVIAEIVVWARQLGEPTAFNCVA